MWVEEEPSGQSVYADKDSQILRLQSSDIAAIAGFHPFKNKFELVDKYLYQDLQNLLALDSKNLGVEVIGKEQEIADIISKLPAKDATALGSLIVEAKRRYFNSVSL